MLGVEVVLMRCGDRVVLVDLAAVVYEQVLEAGVEWVLVRSAAGELLGSAPVVAPEPFGEEVVDLLGGVGEVGGGLGEQAVRNARFAALDDVLVRTSLLREDAGGELVAGAVGFYNPVSGEVAVGPADGGVVFVATSALELPELGGLARVCDDGGLVLEGSGLRLPVRDEPTFAGVLAALSAHTR